MVEFDELLITTGVDALVRLVKQKKRIELTDAAALLNISEETIEEWAGILEEQGILRIDYRLTKIYLSWIAPTEVEIKEEKERFKASKIELKDEIKTIRKSVSAEKEGLDELGESFKDLYSKVSPKLKELEKRVDTIQKAKGMKGERFDEYLARIDSATNRISELDSEIKNSKSEITDIGAKLEKGLTKKTIDKLDSLTADLKKMKDKLAALKKKSARMEKAAPTKAELPSVKEMRQKLNQVIKEYKETRERSARLRQDMIELEEGKDVLKTIGQSMKGYDKKISKMRADIAQLSKQSDELMAKSQKIAQKVAEDKDTLERFSDSMNVAKGIVSRFPSGKNITAELDQLRSAEKSIDERTKALKKLLEIASGSRAAAVEFEDLSLQIDEKMDELEIRIDELSHSLEDEKSTFLSYQSIKERIMPSLNRSKSEMDELSAQMKDMKKEIADQAENLEAEAQKLSKEMGKSNVKEALVLAKEVEEKRVLLEEIKNTIDSLSSSSDNLSRRLAILSRQAGLLELRSTPGAGPEIAPKEKEEITEQLSLTRAEEEEFKRKREELKNLIKRLWEEEK
jgi:chromosome segregation ATPase